jgi:hypothetical protein
MKYYATLEMLVFTAVSAILIVLFPENGGVAYGSVVITYVLLQVVSALAFCVALHKGLVREHVPPPYRYSVKPECQNNWLVMRHIWAYLRLAKKG